VELCHFSALTLALHKDLLLSCLRVCAVSGFMGAQTLKGLHLGLQFRAPSLVVQASPGVLLSHDLVKEGHLRRLWDGLSLESVRQMALFLLCTCSSLLLHPLLGNALAVIPCP
jgi:hypothetical protein